MACEHLKLEHQLCFPVYAVSRLITKQYKPYLDKMGVTYPQYLVLLVLWEEDNMLVNDIAKKLILNTNTITPLLKRMEKQGIIKRKRSSKDGRQVIVSLTKKGTQLTEEASDIPLNISQKLCGGSIEINDLLELRETLKKISNSLTDA